jgi:hypothetical protein
LAGLRTSRSISPTTPVVDTEAQRFRITHPFHPFFGQSFELKGYLRTPYGQRICFDDPRGRFVCIPETFTDLAAPDPFVTVAAGRCYFRVQDLLELVRLLKDLTEGRGARV